MESSVNTELLRSRVDVFILGALREKDGYGYDILNYIYSKTNGHYEMKQSSIYSVLKRLEKQGLISSYLGDESNGGRRRYYSLTDSGRDFLNEEQQQWEYTRTLLNNLVSDKEFDLVTDTPPFKASDLRPLTRRGKNDADLDRDDDNDSTVPSLGDTFEQNIFETEKKYTDDNNTVSLDAEQAVDSQNEILDENLVADNTASVLNEEQPVANEEINDAISSNIVKETEDISTLQEEASSAQDNSGRETVIQESLLSLFDEKDVTSYSHGDFVATKKSDESIHPKMLTETIFADKSIKAEKADQPLKVSMFNADNTKKPVDDSSIQYKYKDVFSDIYQKKKKNSTRFVNTAQTAALLDSDEDVDCSHINDIKNALHNEGFTLKTYKRTEAMPAPSKLVYCNKIIRDTGILSYLFLVIMLLVVYLCGATFKYTGISLLIIGIVALLIPAASTICYLRKPRKKIKSVFSFRLGLTYSLMAFLLIFMLNLLICLLSPRIGYTINNPQLYPPVLMALTIPVSVVIYFLLLKSEHYNSKI